MFSYHSRHSCWQYKRFDPCQGQSDSPSVSLQEQQVTSSDSLRGQSAMPHVSAQQIDSDDEETAFFAAESFVIDLSLIHI